MGLFQQRPDQRDQYQPLINPSDQPAIEMNKEKMERFAPQLETYHYDPTRYKTYLGQLGIQYPTVVGERPHTKI